LIPSEARNRRHFGFALMSMKFLRAKQTTGETRHNLMQVAVRDKQTLDDALQRSGLKPRGEVKFVGRTRQGQEKYSLTLSPTNPVKFVRYSTSGRRMPNVACAHGYECFAKELFEIDPDSSIKSSMTRRQGVSKVTKGNVDYMASDIKQTNVGSRMIPQEYGELCGCEAPKRLKMPVRDYRRMLQEHSSDYQGAIRRAQGYVLRASEAEKLR